MKPNFNEERGIAYGYVASDKLDGDLVHELLYGAQAKNLTRDQLFKDEEARQEDAYEAALNIVAEYTDRQNAVDELRDAFEADLDDFDPEDEEPTIEGVYEGISYRASWLGGALNFFIIDSPYTTLCGGRASPCVPGAGILPGREDGDVLCFDVQPDWYWSDV